MDYGFDVYIKLVTGINGITIKEGLVKELIYAYSEDNLDDQYRVTLEFVGLYETAYIKYVYKHN